MVKSKFVVLSLMWIILTNLVLAACQSADVVRRSPDLPSPATSESRLFSVNNVHDLIFAPDRSLWAATSVGVVRWDVQTGTYDQYTTADGLPSTYVIDLALAPDGTIWAATGEGVGYLDAAGWHTVFDEVPYVVEIGSDGTVWIGGEAGLKRFDGQMWETLDPALPVRDLLIAPDGNIWTAGALGVGHYRPDGSLVAAHAPVDGAGSANAQDIAIDPEGNVWVHVGYNGVYTFDGADWQQVYQQGDQHVCDIAFDASGSPWLGTCGGLHAYGIGLAYHEGDMWSYVTTEQGLASNFVTTLAVGPSGELAVGTDRGVSVYQDRAWHTLRGGPMSNDVTTIAITPGGAVWFGDGITAFRPRGGGVSRFDGEHWTYFLDDARVQKLAVAPDGVLWAGVGCQIWRFDGAEWSQSADCDTLRGNVLSLAIGADGDVWSANGGTLAHFDGVAWVVADRSVNSVALAPDGALWVTGWEGFQPSFYVARWDGEAWMTYGSIDLASSIVGDLAVTPDGGVWGAAGEQGVAHFDGVAWSVDPVVVEGTPVPVSAVQVDPEGVLWARSDLGVLRFDGAAWQVKVPLEELGEGHVQALAFAADGSFWIGTSNGALHK